jgi:Icc-related predicted phosphoesterase
MNIQYCSDLHLEFIKNTYYLHTNRLVPQADILVLAGDIIPLWKNLSKEKYFDFLSNSFKKVYWVPGNHEYYNSDISKYSALNTKDIRGNVHVVKDMVIPVDGVNLIFSTLWSHISVPNELFIKSHLTDFSLIRIGDEAFRPKHFNILHQNSLKFIEHSLSTLKDEKNVVITHHVPTLFNYPEAYKNSPLNEAFAVELYSLIEKYQPEAWIYGHSHCNTPEFTIGKTRLVTNQFGYVDMKEHKDFRVDACINV